MSLIKVRDYFKNLAKEQGQQKQRLRPRELNKKYWETWLKLHVDSNHLPIYLSTTSYQQPTTPPRPLSTRPFYTRVQFSHLLGLHWCWSVFQIWSPKKFNSFISIQVLKMTSKIPGVDPLFNPGKRSAMELSKALATLGFGAWNDLEPGKTNF